MAYQPRHARLISRGQRWRRRALVIVVPATGTAMYVAGPLGSVLKWHW
jgi:hypothetical protein